MKIRSGFVSNSSTSSFIIIGREERISNLTPKDVKKGIVVISDLGYGDAQDVIEVTSVEMLEFIQANPKLFDKAFANAEMYSDSEDVVITEKHLGKKIYGGEMSQHSPENIEELKELANFYSKE